MSNPTDTPVTPAVLPFGPHPSTTRSGGTVDPVRSDLGPLAGLVGSWAGSGLNAIWTPSQQKVTGSDRFLQLASTDDTFRFDALDGSIPNRGLEQPDLFMAGLKYANAISSNGKGIHFETGVWLAVPPTQVPHVGATVARMASIPHGTTINAQGTVAHLDGAPTFPSVSLTPFSIGNPAGTVDFAEQHLDRPTVFRTPDPAAHGFTQAIVDDMNSTLRAAAVAGVTGTTVIDVSTPPPAGIPGGGSANTAFLGPNATASSTHLTIWLQTVGDETTPSVLQYSQIVLLDFNTLSWPHITVGTLRRVRHRRPAPA